MVILLLGAGVLYAAINLAGHLSRQLSRPIDELVGWTQLIRRHEPLAKKTTLRVGGPADWYIEPASEDDLAMTLAFCWEQQLPFFILGRGSNLLVKDGGFRGVAICLSRPFFSGVQVTGLPRIAAVRARVAARPHG